MRLRVTVLEWNELPDCEVITLNSIYSSAIQLKTSDWSIDICVSEKREDLIYVVPIIESFLKKMCENFVGT